MVGLMPAEFVKTGPVETKSSDLTKTDLAKASGVLPVSARGAPAKYGTVENSIYTPFVPTNRSRVNTNVLAAERLHQNPVLSTMAGNNVCTTEAVMSSAPIVTSCVEPDGNHVVTTEGAYTPTSTQSKGSETSALPSAQPERVGVGDDQKMTSLPRIRSVMPQTMCPQPASNTLFEFENPVKHTSETSSSDVRRTLEFVNAAPTLTHVRGNISPVRGLSVSNGFPVLSKAQSAQVISPQQSVSAATSLSPAQACCTTRFNIPLSSSTTREPRAKLKKLSGKTLTADGGSNKTDCPTPSTREPSF